MGVRESQNRRAQRAVTGVLQHEALGLLYDLLVRFAPSVGAVVARAGEARASLQRALGLTSDHAVRQYLGDALG